MSIAKSHCQADETVISPQVNSFNNEIFTIIVRSWFDFYEANV